MTTPVLDVIESIARLVGDEVHDHWGDDVLSLWISEAEVTITGVQPTANPVLATLSLVAGIRQTIPAGGRQIMDVLQNTGGRAVRRIDKGALDVESPTWTTTTNPADPVRGWTPDPTDPRAFFTYPSRDAGTPGSLEIVYAGLPAPVTIADNLNLPDEYVPAIVDYAVFRALSEDSDLQEPGRAEVFYRSFYVRLGVAS